MLSLSTRIPKAACRPMTLLRELIDIPESLPANRFVLRLVVPEAAGRTIK